MTILYNGTDITDSVDVQSCEITDSCDDKADLLEITFNRPQDWMTWKPQIDDEVRVKEQLIDTGVMYVTEVEPADSTYVLRCSTMKRATRAKRWRSWRNKTLSEVMGDCADLCGMGWALYGVNPATHYDFLCMRNESVPSFLRRLMNMEGAVLKCCAGRLTGIGVSYANALTARQTMSITDKTAKGFTWSRHPYEEWKSISVYAYFGNAVATDSDVSSGEEQTFCLPANNDSEAQRWARGLLTTNNMRTETIEMTTQLNSGLTAMGRIDIESTTDMNGEWLVREVTHDLDMSTSSITLMRCRNGVT